MELIAVERVEVWIGLQDRSGLLERRERLNPTNRVHWIRFIEAHAHCVETRVLIGSLAELFELCRAQLNAGALRFGKSLATCVWRRVRRHCRVVPDGSPEPIHYRRVVRLVHLA